MGIKLNMQAGGTKVVLVPNTLLEDLEINKTRRAEGVSNSLAGVLVFNESSSEGCQGGELHFIPENRVTGSVAIKGLDFLDINLKLNSVAWLPQEELPLRVAESDWYRSTYLPNFLKYQLDNEL